MKKRTRRLVQRLSALTIAIALVFMLIVQDTSLIVSATEEVETSTEDDTTVEENTTSEETTSDDTTSDGTTTDGTSEETTSTDGTSDGTDGTTTDGTTSDGTDGSTSDGSTSDGSTTDGTTTDGTTSNGTSDGTTSDGTDSSSTSTGTDNPNPETSDGEDESDDGTETISSVTVKAITKDSNGNETDLTSITVDNRTSDSESGDASDENEGTSYTISLKSTTDGIEIEIDENEIESISDSSKLVDIEVVRDDDGNATGQLEITVSEKYAGTGTIDLSSAITVSVASGYQDTMTLADDCTVSCSISVTVYQELDISKLVENGKLTFTANTTSFVYGETISTGLTGTYDGVTITVNSSNVSVSTTTVGTQNATISASATLNYTSDYYEFIIDSDVTVSNVVTITARPVYVQVSSGSNISVSYGSTLSGYSSVSDWLTAAESEINENDNDDEDGETGSSSLTTSGSVSASLVGEAYGAVESETSGILTGEYDNLKSSIDEILSSVSFTLKSSDDASYTVGTVSDVIGLTFDDADYENKTSYTPENSNYTYIFDTTGDDYYGDLIVTPEELSQETIWAQIEISSGLTEMTDEDGNTSYWVSGTGELKLKISDSSEQEVYDTVMVKISTETDDSSEKLEIKNAIGSSESGTVSDSYELSNTSETDTTEPVVTVYLTGSNDDGNVIYQTVAVGIPSGKFTIDDQDPTVTLTDPEKLYDSSTASGDAESNTVEIKVVGYYNEEDTITFTVSDGNQGIGIETIQYAFLDVSEFDDLDSLTQAQLIEEVNKVTWEDYDGESISCADQEDGEYLVVIKAVDYVGNTTIVTSNGIYIDTTDPEVELKINDDENGSTSLYNGGSISYTATITDPLKNDVASGIASIEVVVTRNGEEISGQASNYSDSFELESVEGLEASKNDDGSVSYTLNGTATIEDGETQTIVITVTAYDKAGNPLDTDSTTAKVTSSELTADAADPEITSVEYYLAGDENQESEITSEITNATETDRYYENGNIIAVITVEERDLSEGSVIAEINDKKYDINASSPSLPDGVSVEKSDTTDKGDSSTTTYTLTFGASNQDYDFVLSKVTATDSAGNESTEYDGCEGYFTVDQLAPTVAVTYADASENTLEPGTESDCTNENYVYSNSAVTATVTITERNFSEKGVVVTITYTDNAGDKRTVEASSYLNGSWSNGGNDTHTATFTFGSDGYYSFDVSCTDLAENEDSTNYEDHYFAIDTTDPVISVVYTDSSGNVVSPTTKSSSPLYEDETITATVTITERNFGRVQSEFADPQMDLTYTATNAYGNDVSVTNYTSAADTMSGWTASTDGSYEYTQTFTFKKDANYSLKIEYQDLAENSVTYATHYFTVDTTKPTGTITLQDYTSSSFASKIYFAFFEQDPQTYTVDTDDSTSGVKKVQYYKYKASKDSSGTLTGLTKDELEDITSWKTYKNSGVTVSRDEQTFLYVKITDNSGNVTYINTKKGVIVDNTNPADATIEITTAKKNTVTVNGSSVGLYDGDVNFSVTATDPTNDSTYSGLAEVYYEIRKDGSVTQSGVLYECTTTSQRVQSVSRSATVSASKNNSNDVEIYVRVTDKAGNISEETQALAIDITDPTVSVVYGSETAYNGTYYQSRTATVTITERNLDTSQVDLICTNDGSSYTVSHTSWVESGSGDSKTWTTVVTFSEDGDYTFTVDVEDMATNTDSYTTVDSFVIDDTDPVITITYSNDDDYRDGYYNADQVATITVVEHNFNSSDFQALVNGSNVSLSWNQSGDTYTAKYTFSEDNDYTFSVSYTDLAGNDAESPEEVSFTVDQTAPIVTISGVENSTAYSGAVTIYITYTDTNYIDYSELIANGEIIITITTATGETYEWNVIDVSTVSGGVMLTLEDIDWSEEFDDIYTISVIVYDKAGNCNVVDIGEGSTVTFSVNRNGANFVLSDATSEYVANVYQNEEKNVVITATSSVALESYTVSVNGQSIDEDEGYTVRDSGGGENWYQYVYTIDASNFTEEATYEVVVRTKDEVGNSGRNDTWHDGEAAIEFIIDKTAPIATISGIVDDTNYNTESETAIISLSDNISPTVSIQAELVYEDSGVVTEITEDDLVYNDDGTISYVMLSHDGGDQTLRVYATDLAGNTTEEPAEATVFISSSVTARTIYWAKNNWWLILIIILIILLIIFLILWKRRKKEEEEEGRPSTAAKA